MARYGYGYTRLNLRILATDTALYLKKKNVTSDKLLGDKWLTCFMKRNPSLKVKKPRALNILRAKSVTREAVGAYFGELENIMNKYDLLDKPQCIYNIDESGLTPEHVPRSVIGPVNEITPAITSPRGPTTTVIAGCSAIGQSVPPMFVFKGKRATPELMKGALPGSGIHMSDSGWSNSVIFEDYLKNHFIKYVPQGNSYILVLYDGHTSHVSKPLIEWAQSQRIMLFVLPPHTSHVLQPLDVGVFGSFKTSYYALCQDFMRRNPGEVITRYTTCEIASKAYAKSLTLTNIISSFKKTGVFPFNPGQYPRKLVIRISPIRACGLAWMYTN